MVLLISLECSGCKATLTSGSNFRPLPVEKKTAAVTKNERKMIENGHRNRHEKKNAKMYKTKMTMSSGHRSDVHVCCSSSTGISCDALGFSSGGEDVKAKAMLSSTSFSSDSAEYYSRPSFSSTKKKNKNKNKNKKKTNLPRDHESRHGKNIEEKAVADVEVDRGVAVERRSTDLYGDFRRSMVEMMMAKGKIRSVGDMNRLLQRYISLNSSEHHPVIIKAFSDIYKGCMFS